MLARLAFTRGLVDWSDPEAVTNLRIIDPACGTGTLLMAALEIIKSRVAEARELNNGEKNALHKRLVEDVLCGLDINRHGVQLAACNMTLGAPTVDYARMNLVTMPHGPQSDGPPKAGSLEILTAADNARDLSAMTAPSRSLESLDAAQVDESAEIRFPLRDLDAVIMNAPFTDNRKRSRKVWRAPWPSRPCSGTNSTSGTVLLAQRSGSGAESSSTVNSVQNVLHSARRHS